MRPLAIVTVATGSRPSTWRPSTSPGDGSRTRSTRTDSAWSGYVPLH